MGDVVNNAKEDLAKAERLEADLSTQLTDVRNQVAKLRAFLEVYAEYTTKEPNHRGWSTAKPILGKAERQGLAPGTAGGKMEAAAAQAIYEAGRSLDIQELLAAIQAAGLRVGGERPATNLSSILSRSHRIKFERGNGLRLVDQPKTD